jgi:hypothetical protein
MTNVLNNIYPEIEAALLDLVERLDIESNLMIYHPEYGRFGLVADALEKFSQLPKELQEHYLRSQLQNLIYMAYYNGSIKSRANNNRDLNLENNTVMGINVEFYDRLQESNRSSGYFDPDWWILRTENDNTLIVQKGEIILHVNLDRHLHPESRRGLEQVAELVPYRHRIPIFMPKNRLMQGFYVAVGNEGMQSVGEGMTIVRVYFNFTAEGAVEVMRELTSRLNEESILFSFKVLYDPDDYGRYDSGVLYFDREDYPAVRQVLDAVYRDTDRYFQPEIPLFSKKLFPGMGLAEEPHIHLAGAESFGMHRCQIIARGLMQARARSDESPESRLDCIVEQFTAVGIDLSCPYLNSQAEDIY